MSPEGKPARLAFAENGLIKIRGAAFFGVAWLISRRDSEISKGRVRNRTGLSIGPKDKQIEWMAMLTYEALGQRDDSIKLLEAASYAVLADVSRFPDLADLARDSRFLSRPGLNRDK